MNTLRTLAAAAVVALGTSAVAGPVEVDFSSSQTLHGKGSFSGTAFYDDTTEKLTLNITNTSKGALTGFAFEVEKGDAAKYERPSHSHWRDERNHKGMINATPFGKYQGGAAVNGHWGSTAVKAGLAAGHTGTYVFDITGANASSLTTGDFFTGTKPEIVASFTGFKKSHYQNDRAGGFGKVVIPTVTTTTVTSNTPTGNTNPVLNLQPPPIIGGPIAKPISGPVTGGGNAVPLPPALPAGLAMLGVFAVVKFVRRIRGMTA
jgi:hypothetical protein